MDLGLGFLGTLVRVLAAGFFAVIPGLVVWLAVLTAWGATVYIRDRVLLARGA